MGLVDDLKADVSTVFTSAWEERDGQVIPEAKDLKLGNDAVNLEGTVLYADLAESTNLVNTYKSWFAAEMYKVYLHCAAKIIRSEGGVITSYDGDRVMAVYIGDNKEDHAARSALKIYHAVNEIINPLIASTYPKDTYRIRQAVGVDSSKLFIARTGIRGSNDLVWVGRAANYAAKMCDIRTNYRSFITAAVYNQLSDNVKLSHNKQRMWESYYWKARDINIYGSTWMWEP